MCVCGGRGLGVGGEGRHMHASLRGVMCQRRAGAWWLLAMLVGVERDVLFLMCCQGMVSETKGLVREKEHCHVNLGVWS